MEKALGDMINRQPFWRKVFSAAGKQGLQHLADMPWGGEQRTLRLLKFTGDSEESLESFLKAHPEKIGRLNDNDHYDIVAASMLRGTHPQHAFPQSISTTC